MIHRKSILYLSNNFVCITVYGEIKQDVKGINIMYLKMHIQVFFKLMIIQIYVTFKVINRFSQFCKCLKSTLDNSYVSKIKKIDMNCKNIYKKNYRELYYIEM